jgi:hypothetical protein
LSFYSGHELFWLDVGFSRLSSVMVNYYEILKVSNKASRTEIKSAYRRLARKLHPDRNNGSEETALKFAAIAEAYEVLGNKDERARYDRRLLDVQYSSTNGNTVFASTNPHAKRWRQMVYEKRYNDIIDSMIAEERREAIALQKFLFPMVALLISTFVAGLIRPNLFLSDVLSSWVGNVVRIAIISLFVIGIIHLVGRIRSAIDRYAYDDTSIHESLLDDQELPFRRISRYSMTALIILGIVVALASGLSIGYGLDLRSAINPRLFSDFPQMDVLIFPPIFVLVVDAVHGFILNIES